MHLSLVSLIMTHLILCRGSQYTKDDMEMGLLSLEDMQSSQIYPSSNNSHFRYLVPDVIARVVDNLDPTDVHSFRMCSRENLNCVQMSLTMQNNSIHHHLSKKELISSKFGNLLSTLRLHGISIDHLMKIPICTPLIGSIHTICTSNQDKCIGIDASTQLPFISFVLQPLKGDNTLSDDAICFVSAMFGNTSIEHQFTSCSMVGENLESEFNKIDLEIVAEILKNSETNKLYNGMRFILCNKKKHSRFPICIFMCVCVFVCIEMWYILRCHK